MLTILGIFLVMVCTIIGVLIIAGATTVKKINYEEMKNEILRRKIN